MKNLKQAWCGECGSREHEIWMDDHHNPTRIEFRCKRCPTVNVIEVPREMSCRSTPESPGGIVI